MTANPTGPELFRRSWSELELAFERDQSSARGRDAALLSLEFAKADAIQANTAALVMLGELFATAMNLRSADLDAWAKVIPSSPLTECWGMEKRRPQCADRHTDDCTYTDPVREPQKPTGPRIYVEHRHGKQGHVVDVSSMNGILMFLVQWHVPGTRPLSKAADSVMIIPADHVQRCPNGQTGDECGSGENQCEPCRQAEDAEGDEIEESMGLR